MEGNTSHSQKSIFIFLKKSIYFYLYILSLHIFISNILFFLVTLFTTFHHFHRVSTTCTLNDIEINPTTVPMHHRERCSNRDMWLKTRVGLRRELKSLEISNSI